MELIRILNKILKKGGRKWNIPEGTEEKGEKLVISFGILSRIRTEHLPETRQECYRLNKRTFQETVSNPASSPIKNREAKDN
jgi:hypothetical protein